MKKIFTLIIAISVALSVHAQQKQTILVWSNGTSQSIAGVDSITFAASSQPGNPITSDALLQRLRNVANKFIGKIHSADFTNVSSITDRLDNTDSNVLDEWSDNIIETITDRTGTKYRNLWRASNFTGHFRLSGSRWVQESGSYSDLQFTMTDNAGRQCVARVTWSGNTHTVHADFLDWEDEEDNYPWTEYDVRNEWQVPEQVVATVTQAGSEIARVTVNTTFTTDGDFPTQADATVAVSAKVNNYEVAVNRAAATGNDHVDADITITVSGEQLLHATANGNVHYEDDEVTAGAATITCDVLGEVQLSTYTDNLKSYSDYLDLDGQMLESEAQSRVNSANQLATNRLCLDGSSAASATFYFKAVQEDDYYSLSQRQYWEVAPVLKIASDGREVAFEDYFSEDNFRSVIDNYDDLVDSFKKLFDY